jgi:DNA-binding HxlR family transcriptional regulator
MADMARKRTYGEGCAAAHALDLVGERWALLIVRELLLGPKRFTDLHAGVLHASANLLAQRLRELEHVGIVRRRTLPPPAPARVYELTEWGRELEPVLVGLGRWGSRSPQLPAGAEMSLDAQMLALKAMFDPAAARGLSASFEIGLGPHRFHVTVADGQLELARGNAPSADAIIETDRNTLSDLLWHDRPVDDALRAGDARIIGDGRAVERFTRLFPAPAPAVPGAAHDRAAAGPDASR